MQIHGGWNTHTTLPACPLPPTCHPDYAWCPSRNLTLNTQPLPLHIFTQRSYLSSMLHASLTITAQLHTWGHA
jgi:hypothetical protein